jgi:hypothetical protein
MLSSLFAASASDVTNDTDPQDHPNVNCKPVEVIKLGALAKVLEVDPGPLDPLDTSGEQFVIPISAELAGKLASKLPASVATRWVASSDWDADDALVNELLGAISKLAARAKRERLQLFLWMSL